VQQYNFEHRASTGAEGRSSRWCGEPKTVDEPAFGEVS